MWRKMGVVTVLRMVDVGTGEQMSDDYADWRRESCR